MTRVLIAITLSLCGSVWAETNYYLVEGALELPTGRRVGTSLSLAKRTVDRTAGKIEEVVLSMREQEPALETITLIRIDGENATLSSSSPQGGFSGQGKLSGPQWAWTRMTFTVKMDQGTTVEGEDEFAPESITATKRVLGPDGKLQIIVRESGRTISESLYNLLRNRLKSK
jgi:hypothetical protein